MIEAINSKKPTRVHKSSFDKKKLRPDLEFAGAADNH
jgi:hypothetical protein